MEQFRQIGEVLGSLRALMIFRDEIKINQRQCTLLFDSFSLAFDSVAEEIRRHLKFDEKVMKWKALEQPLKELHKIFREGEGYIRNCLEYKDWWGKAIALNENTDCVQFYVHNLLWCVPVVLEAIEVASEISGNDQEEMNKKKIMFVKKYDKDWMDQTLFEHRFGKVYLVSHEMCKRFDSVLKEDRWLASEIISEKKGLVSSKQETRLSELLLSPKGKIHPCSILLGSQDYQVKRRLGGTGINCKEIQWMGEWFAMKHAIREGDVEKLLSEFSLHASLVHPNVMNYMYTFCDEEKKECFVVMELMTRDLSCYIKEVCCPRKRVPFNLLVAVDVMLQVARGMEYLHSKKIYHGDLNPSNILVKVKNSSPDGYLHVKVANFGQYLNKDSKGPVSTNPCIWYAPEVLEKDLSDNSRYNEKADVYSFGMICFELLTGKVPFEDCHLQGDKMSRNIRAGERPLFPFPSPKYLANLTKRCWHVDPVQRPKFSSITRMLRYIKRFLVMNPDNGQAEPMNPSVDYFDIETSLSKRLSNWSRKEFFKVSEIPFQMYAYRVVEREKSNLNVIKEDVIKEKSSDSGGEGALVCGDENGSHISDVPPEDLQPNFSGSINSNLSTSPGTEGSKKGIMGKKADGKPRKPTGQPQKAKTVRVPQLACGQSLRLNSVSPRQFQPVMMSPRRQRTSASDSELS